MKTKIFKSILLASILCFVITGCIKDTCTSSQTYIKFVPVYLSPEEIRKDITIEAPKSIQNPGKIYYYDHYLMVNEYNEGIHIIDNADPSNPKPIAFWNVKGNVDIAIKDGFMYLDQYVDLVTFDISDFLNPKFSCRRNDVFVTLFPFDSQNGYLIEYKQTEVTEDVDCYKNVGPYYFGEGGVFFDANALKSSGFQGTITPTQLSSFTTGSQGLSGSFARFGFGKDFLYALNNFSIIPFDLSIKDCPVPQQMVNIGWNVETIFPYNEHLFIGAPTGLFIYSIANQARPQFVSSFNHATGCDPVVVEGNTAYVTVRGGTPCNGITNELDIINIENLFQPTLLQSYNMTSPKGVGLAKDIVYVCDDGLKIYDRTDLKKLKLLSHTKMEATDVIALGDHLVIVIGKDGYRQYDTRDPSKPVEISKINVL